VNGLKHQKEKRSMDHFAGLDVSVKETNVCIVDDVGKIVREVKVAIADTPSRASRDLQASSINVNRPVGRTSISATKALIAFRSRGSTFGA
jgi:hypothetical protein